MTVRALAPLALALVVGCVQPPQLDVPETACVGETVEAVLQRPNLGRDLFQDQRVEGLQLAPSNARVVFTGAETASTGWDSSRQGLGVRSRRNDGPQGSRVAYPFHCVLPGVETITAEFLSEDDLEDGESSFAPLVTTITCELCGVPDALGDWFDSISALSATLNAAANDIAAVLGTVVDYNPLGSGDAIGDDDDDDDGGMRNGGARDWPGEPEGTDPAAERVVVPASADAGLSEDGGTLAVVAMQVVEPPAVNDDEGPHFIYAAVFDSDGDPANDWVAQDPFDWDTYQGADRWYELFFHPGFLEWSLRVTQVDAGQGRAQVDSGAVAVFEGATLTFFIPGEELPGAQPTFRAVAFAHDGEFSEDARGADVNGADPTEALTPLASP